MLDEFIPSDTILTPEFDYEEYDHLEIIDKLLEYEEDELKEDKSFTYLEKLELFPKVEGEAEENKVENKINPYRLINRRIDYSKIRHKNAKSLEVHTSICKNVKLWGDHPLRSGAIIYTHHEGKTYFCMGEDASYGDLTDFAGGVKKGESILEGGLRELEEESQGVFGKLEVKDIENSLAFYSSNMLIMFIRLDVDMKKIKKKFQSKYRYTEDDEVSNIVWLEKEEFLEAILGKGRRVYSRVKKILSNVTNIIQAL